jgi:hypothetical protein
MFMPERRIVAIGGGDSWVAFDYVLALVGPMPRLLWVGTAGAEDAARALRMHDHTTAAPTVAGSSSSPGRPRISGSSCSRRT